MRKFNIKGMSCAACSARVEKAVSEAEKKPESAKSPTIANSKGMSIRFKSPFVFKKFVLLVVTYILFE